MLPRSVAAVFYTSGTDPGCAIRTYQTIVNMYDLDPGEVLLLKHHPGRTPGFVKDAFMDKMPPKPEEACPRPTDWCASGTQGRRAAWGNSPLATPRTASPPRVARSPIW